jgi:hypothetical protein
MRLTTIAIALFLFVSPATADRISIYEGPQNWICVGNAPSFVPFSVYVVHDFAFAGTTGSRWLISDFSGMLRLGFDCGTLGAQGDPYTGIVLDYGSCLGSTVTVCRLDFFKPHSNEIQGCYHLEVYPYPGDPEVQSRDCSQGNHAAGAGYYSFDAMPYGLCDDCATATKSVTWGAIKSLYR